MKKNKCQLESSEYLFDNFEKRESVFEIIGIITSIEYLISILVFYYYFEIYFVNLIISNTFITLIVLALLYTYPRTCPKCNIKMKKIRTITNLVIKCEKCGYSYATIFLTRR